MRLVVFSDEPYQYEHLWLAAGTNGAGTHVRLATAVLASSSAKLKSGRCVR